MIGIGGSATNDGGFGMARALGWKFLDQHGKPIESWTELKSLTRIVTPNNLRMKITVAVDVQNPLLGLRGATRVYGPQKGLLEKDFAIAESALGKLARISKGHFNEDFPKIPGAGAAGGLGFGLMAFVGAKPESGFEIFSHAANLEKRLRKADLVLTGEGAIDVQTLMGKGVGELALRCKKLGLSCLAIAGTTVAGAQKLFTQTRGLVEITSIENAKSDPEKYLVELSSRLAQGFKPS
jgi:glycerate kinase